jgi:flagellar hook-associated protein 1 FlgK
MLNIASGAMQAQQVGIQVIEQNVTNASTPGYRRQEAVFKNGLPYGDLRFKGSAAGGQLGTGVVIEEIKRYNQEFYDGRYRTEAGEAKRWDTEASILKETESVLNETSDNGLTAVLDQFWSSWQTLNSDPSNMGIRADVRDSGQALVKAFNRRAEELSQIRSEQDLLIKTRVDEINTIATKLAALNKEIPRVKSLSNQPNDLMDERDRLLDRLAEITDIQSSTQVNGETIVSLGGHVLVVGTKTNTLSTVTNNTNSNLVDIQWSDGSTLTPQTGELKGLFNARDVEIKGQQDGLDQLAQTLSDQVNLVHNHGFSMHDPSGIPTPPPPPLPPDATAYNFFKLNNPPGSVASRLALDDHISDTTNGLANIAAAEGPNYAPGDGNNAKKLSDLQHSKVLVGGTTTMNDYYAQQIAELGLIVRRAETSAADHKDIMKSLNDTRDQVGGVSLDEEATKLMQSQKAYNAAARVLTTIDDMLDRVINGMGRVGI